jgi:hypothetical protein
VYGPVRTVVWQGSAGDRRPYADQGRITPPWDQPSVGEDCRHHALVRETGSGQNARVSFGKQGWVNSRERRSFRVLELIEAERQVQINSGAGGNRSSR